MLVAYLDPVDDEQSILFKELVRTANEQGFQFDYPVVGSESPKEFLKGLDKARHLLETADAFFIISSSLFESCPDFVDLLRDRIAHGARLLVQPYPIGPSFDWWSAFLAPYDLCPTKLRISFENRYDNVEIVPDVVEIENGGSSGSSDVARTTFDQERRNRHEEKVHETR